MPYVSAAWNPSLVSLQEVVVTGLFIFDEAIRRYVATSDEFVLIANYGGVSFEQAKVITPRLAFQVLELYLVIQARIKCAVEVFIF